VPAMFNSLHSSTNKQLLKISSAIKVPPRTISITNGSNCMPATKSTLFAMSKDEWDTEGPVKSMKNVLYVQRYGKRHLSD